MIIWNVLKTLSVLDSHFNAILTRILGSKNSWFCLKMKKLTIFTTQQGVKWDLSLFLGYFFNTLRLALERAYWCGSIHTLKFWEKYPRKTQAKTGIRQNMNSIKLAHICEQIFLVENRLSLKHHLEFAHSRNSLFCFHWIQFDLETFQLYSLMTCW